MMTGIEGKRRVKNVFVGEEPISPQRYYTVVGPDYILLKNGDRMTAFDGAELLQECVKPDNQALIDYSVHRLGGEVDAGYADSYGKGAITVLNGGR